METTRPTISSHFARLLLRRAVELGSDESQLLGVLESTHELLADRTTRMTPAQLGGLMRELWKTLDDELFGLAAAPHKFGMFALMARHTTTCKDLREALRYSVQFYSLLSPALEWQLKEGPRRVRLTLNVRDRSCDPEHFLEEFLLLVWHRYFNWLIGTRMPLLRTELCFSLPVHGAEHHIMFPGPLRYDSGASSISFAASFLDKPVLRSRADLRRYLQFLPDYWFIKLVFDHSISDRIYQTLMQAEPEQFPNMVQLAQSWQTTTRTLHRHLQQEETSFRMIRDQVRRDRAISWLLEDSCPVGEIARRLGMTEPAFSRAFKNWTGFTPLVYRRSRAGWV
jgi:AraC-like DNA-binding protein